MSDKKKEIDRETHFAPGTVIFKEGERGDCLYVLVQGQAEVFKDGRDGARIPIAIVNSGQCLGEFSALDGKPRSATAIALTPVRAVKVDGPALSAQLAKIPSWLRTMMINLVDRLRATDEVLRRNAIVDEHLRDQIIAARTRAGLKGPGEVSD